MEYSTPIEKTMINLGIKFNKNLILALEFFHQKLKLTIGCPFHLPFADHLLFQHQS